MDSSDNLLHHIDAAQQLRVFLGNKVRLDGRMLTERRVVQLKQTFLDAPSSGVFGSSQVKLGGTSVVCAINLMVGVPSVHTPSSGDLVCDVSLGAGCNLENVDQKSKSNKAFELENIIKDVFIRGKLIDREQLSIIKGRYAYRLCIKVTCLSNTGNMQDAVILAVMAALCDCKLPLPVMKDNVVMTNTDVLRKLSLAHCCVAVTVGLFEGVTLLDPSRAEEDVQQGSVTCVFAMPAAQICYIHQHSATQSWSAQHLQAVAETCRVEAVKLFASVQNALKT